MSQISHVLDPGANFKMPALSSASGEDALPLPAVTHLHTGVLDQAELLLYLLELLLLPADVSLQDPRSLL